MGKGIGDAIDPKNYGSIEYRDEQLKDNHQNKLYRAEALISVGFFDYAVEELNDLEGLDNASSGFLFYFIFLL